LKALRKIYYIRKQPYIMCHDSDTPRRKKQFRLEPRYIRILERAKEKGRYKTESDAVRAGLDLVEKSMEELPNDSNETTACHA
jgi:hypothetical protein